MRPRTPPRTQKTADPSPMPVHHQCPLCDFAREAAHSTVLDPICPRCGSVLAPVSSVAAAPAAPAVARLTRARWFERILIAVVLTPLLLAAVKIGWGAAGVSGGSGALVLAGLVSFVALAPATRHS